MYAKVMKTNYISVHGGKVQFAEVQKHRDSTTG